MADFRYMRHEGHTNGSFTCHPFISLPSTVSVWWLCKAVS